jgi:hypothetical protein
LGERVGNLYGKVVWVGATGGGFGAALWMKRQRAGGAALVGLGLLLACSPGLLLLVREYAPVGGRLSDEDRADLEVQSTETSTVLRHPTLGFQLELPPEMNAFEDKLRDKIESESGEDAHVYGFASEEGVVAIIILGTPVRGEEAPGKYLKGMARGFREAGGSVDSEERTGEGLDTEYTFFMERDGVLLMNRVYFVRRNGTEDEAVPVHVQMAGMKEHEMRRTLDGFR